jgi:hypothetical protein
MLSWTWPDVTSWLRWLTGKPPPPGLRTPVSGPVHPAVRGDGTTAERGCRSRADSDAHFAHFAKVNR